MGIFNELVKVIKSSTKTLSGYPGQSQVAQVEGFGDTVNEVEVFGSPGLASSPAKGTTLVLVPIAGSKEYAVAIGTTNYALGESLNQGETLLYSMNSLGASLAAKIKTKPDGSVLIESMLGADITVKTSGKVKYETVDEIQFMGSSKNLVKFQDLDTALQTFKTSIEASLALKLDGAGSSGSISLDISSAKADKLKTG